MKNDVAQDFKCNALRPS